MLNLEKTHQDDINRLEVFKANRSEYEDDIKALQSQLTSLVLGAVGDGNNAEVVQARGGFDTLSDRLLKNDLFVSDLVDLFIKDDTNKLVDIWTGTPGWKYEKLPYGIKITKATDISRGNGGFSGKIPLDLIPEKIIFKATATNDMICGVFIFKIGSIVSSFSDFLTIRKGTIDKYFELPITKRQNIIQYLQENPDCQARFLLWNNTSAGYPFKAGEQAILENLAFDSDSYERGLININAEFDKVYTEISNTNTNVTRLDENVSELNSLLNVNGIQAYNVSPKSDTARMRVQFLDTGMQITWKQEVVGGNEGITIVLDEIPNKISFDFASSECGVNEGLYVWVGGSVGMRGIVTGSFPGVNGDTHVSVTLTSEHKAKIQEYLAENDNTHLRYVIWNRATRYVGDWIRVTNFQVDNQNLTYSSIYNQTLKNSADIEGLQISKANYSDLHLNNIEFKDKNIWKFDGITIDKWFSGANVVVVDGKIHYIYPNSTGNNGFQSSPIKYSDTSNGFLTIKIRACEVISGGYAVYIFGRHKSTGENHYIHLKSFDNLIENSISVDLNYHGVYSNLDLSKSFTILIANNTGVCDITFDKFEVWDNYSQLDQTKTLTENLNIMKADIETLKLDTPEEKPSNTEIIDEDGNKYILQSYSGQLKLIPKIPKNILYIGNSLLLGFGTFGMCASNNSEDYYTYTNNYVAQYHPQLVTNRLGGSPYEGCVTSQEQDNYLNNSLLPKLNDNLELVIVQLGDNVNTAEKLAVFEEGSKKMCKFIRTHAPNARVAWVAAWYTSDTKQQWISNACAEYGCKFIDIRPLYSVAGNRSYIGAKITYPDGTIKTVDNSGVASHPSSQGMKQIADKIIAELFE